MLHTTTTHHFRYGHQPSIQQNLNNYIIIYSLRDISATNLAIFLVARVFVETPLHQTEFKRIHAKKPSSHHQSHQVTKSPNSNPARSDFRIICGSGGTLDDKI
jgi:hypothetical protein